MSSWFGASNSNLDEQVEKATSSSLEDIALNLEISDIIRSKTVLPKEAMRSLKKRIGHKNPNVQLAALGLTDTCVKNGGSHFLVEIATREFMDNMVSLLRAPGAINAEVRGKMLELIQIWASAFEGNPSLSYVGDVYRNLKSDGFDFPPPIKVSSTFVDSSAPPEWTDADVCMRCRTTFTFTNRKHHCRNCGSVFCGACSSKSIALPRIGIPDPVRVCDGCHTKVTERKIPPSSKIHHSHHAAKRITSSSMQPRNARVEQDDDEDLKRALQMSLDDLKGGGGYVPHPQPQKVPESKLVQSTPAAPTAVANTAEDEDEELKVAIAASLRDMEEQKAKASWSTPAVSSGSAIPAKIERPDHELSPAEAENINLFATLVDRLQMQPPGTILREPQIQELYESIGALRPKLARTFGETMSKYETLCDLHAKLGTAVRYYDRMLEERLSYTYGRHGLGGTVPQAPYQPQQPTNSLYPAVPQAESYYGGGPPAPIQNPPMGPVQPQYGNYYTQPQAFDKPANFAGVPQPQYAQYNGYSAPSTPRPQNEPQQGPPQSQPPPQQQAQPNIPPTHLPPTQPSSGADQQLPPPSQATPQPQAISSPPPPAWQYQSPGHSAEFQYSYPPPQKQQQNAPQKQQEAYPQPQPQPQRAPPPQNQEIYHQQQQQQQQQHVPPPQPQEAYPQQQHAQPQRGYPAPSIPSYQAQPNPSYTPVDAVREYPAVPVHLPQPKAVEECLIEL